MGEVVAAAQGKSLESAPSTTATASARPGTIGFASLRGGDIVGDHTVLFAGTGERIEITHRSTSRATYADGSLRAARFVARPARRGCSAWTRCSASTAADAQQSQP